jgi:hypothetical protein
LLNLRVGRLEAGLERIGRDDCRLTLAGLEHHRGVGRRHSDRNARVGGDRRQQQPLKQAAGENIANLGVGEVLLREECLISAFVELAVQPLGGRNLRDFGVDQPLRQREVVLVGKGHEDPLVNERIEDRVQVADDAGVVGVGPLLPRLLQLALHLVAQLALGDFLVADLGQRPAARPEAEIAGAEIGKIGEREAAHDGDDHEHHDSSANLGLGYAAEEGEHRGPGAVGR